jgi:MFS family permease
MEINHELEDSVVESSAQVYAGETEGWSQKLLHAFPAFHIRNYQLYFVGQLVSLVGTWLQIVAEGLLVWNLTHSAYAVGVITALGLIPVLLFSLFGGVIVDRYHTKSLLVATQTASMVLALIYGILTATGHISVEGIGILAFLLGTVNAVDMPARQSFVVEVVGKEYLSSAIALNSGMFNTARVIGPVIGGILIALVGVGGAFIINGISYIASIWTIQLIRVAAHVHEEHPHPLVAIKEGLAYTFSNKVLRTLVIFSGAMSIFGWSYSTLMPVLAEQTFHQPPIGLSYLYAAAGIGALTGAVVVSVFSKRFPISRMILAGCSIFFVALLAFTFTHSFIIALPLLTLAGFGLLLQFSLIMTTVQHMVEDSVRGRVMSIYTLSFMGLAPIGSYVIGILAEHFGPMLAIQLNILCVSTFIVYLFTKRKLIESEHLKHIHN